MDFHEVSSLKPTIPPLVQLNETWRHPNDVENADQTAGNLKG
jgi:hypothetical protein